MWKTLTPSNASQADFVKWNEQRESDRVRIAELEAELASAREEVRFWTNEAARYAPRK